MPGVLFSDTVKQKQTNKQQQNKQCFYWINLFEGDSGRHKSNIVVTHNSCDCSNY